MRLLTFIKKEILHVLHERESLLLMILFPFALTLVLGSALGSTFNRVLDMPETNLPIVAKGNMQSAMYMNQAKSAGLIFHEATVEEAQQQVKKGESDGYVVLDDGDVTFFTDHPGSIASMLVRTYSQVYANQATMASLAVQKGRFDQLALRGGNYIQTQSVELNNEPSSFGYYGVTMMTMIMMYGAIQAVNMMDLERKQRTYMRLKSSPFSMNGVYLAKSSVSMLALLGQVLILMVGNNMIYHVDYRNILVVLLMLIPYALFCNGLGLMTYQLASSAEAATGLLNLLTVILVFTGGGYVPLSTMAPSIASIMSYSPVGMVNNGLLEYIYRNDLSTMTKAMVVTGSLGIVMMLVAFVLYKKEEGSDRAAGY